MSIKALQRRAREARHWLGERALPLWSESGSLRGSGGFVQELELNHRPSLAPEPGDALVQHALIALFRLAPRVGFDTGLAEARIEAALEVAGEAPLLAAPDVSVERSLTIQCDELRRRLVSFAGGRGEDAILGAKAACRSFDHLMDEFLTPEGGWIVGYDAGGFPVANVIPGYLAGPVAEALGPLLPFAEA